MAGEIAVISSQKVFGQNGGTTPSFDSTGANCIAIYAAYGGAITISDNKGNTFSTGTEGADTVKGRWYFALNATVGTNHTVTLAGASTASGCIVLALSNVLTASAYSSTGATSISGNNPINFRVTATPPEANCFVAFGIALGTTAITSATAGSGWSIPQWYSGEGGDHYGNIVVCQTQTTIRTVGATEPLVTTNTVVPVGIDVVAFFKQAPAAPPEGITISSPVTLKNHQRSGTTGTIQISGTVSGSTESIEARFNGGAWATIATNVAPGAYSGNLTNQAQGQGLLEVRKITTTTTTASVADIGIGEIFMTGGDSISDGRADNVQNFAHATLKATRFSGGTWSLLNESSHWPVLASILMADLGVPVSVIKTGVGGTDLYGTGSNTWVPGNGDYNASVTAGSNSGAAAVKAALMHFGPNAVANATTPTKTNYNTAVDTFSNSYSAALAGAPKVYIGVFGEMQTAAPPDRVSALNATREAILEAVGDNTNVRMGPNLLELDYTDDVHPKPNAQILIVAIRWYLALKGQLYAGSNGRGPRVLSTSWDTGRTQCTVVFDRPLKTGLTHALQPWRILDNGTPLTISSVAYHGSNNAALVITVSTAPVGAINTSTVTLGYGDTAVGRVVPTSVDITLPGSYGNAAVPAEPFYNRTVTEVDTTPPVVSSPTGTKNGHNAATGTVSVNETGTLWYLINTSPTATNSAIKAASSQTITATGVQNVSSSGLSPSTTYYYHYLSTDAASNDATTAVHSSAFTTDAAPPGPATAVSLTIPSAASVTGVGWSVWTGTNAGSLGTKVAEGTNASFNGSGLFTMNISGQGITQGQVVGVVLSKNTGSPSGDANGFIGPATAS